MCLVTVVSSGTMCSLLNSLLTRYFISLVYTGFIMFIVYVFRSILYFCISFVRIVFLSYSFSFIHILDINGLHYWVTNPIIIFKYIIQEELVWIHKNWVFFVSLLIHMPPFLELKFILHLSRFTTKKYPVFWGWYMTKTFLITFTSNICKMKLTFMFKVLRNWCRLCSGYYWIVISSFLHMYSNSKKIHMMMHSTICIWGWW